VNDPLLVLTGLVVLGVGAQWIAWRLKLPSILLLLPVGLIAGPATGFIQPDEILGDYLFPFVSLGVAVILFEGGLSLRLRELEGLGGALRNLISIGVLASWGVSALAAHLVLGLDWRLALLLGALLTVSGPTVVGPLLRHVRPTGRVGNLAKWEGIAVDPIGAVLAVLVLEGILIGELGQATGAVLLGLLRTAVVGTAIGAAGAFVLLRLLRLRLIPERLHSPATLAAVVFLFALCNRIQQESGILGVAVAGMVMANQERVRVRHIIEFKENLRVLLISTLFILLAARVDPADLILHWRTALFLVILILVGRPLSVELATLRSDISRPERLFLWCMAPRGIVAAAVSGLFAMRLEEAGFEQAGQVAAVTFLVIIATVAVYGLAAAPLARRLGLARLDPQGVVFVGAHPWAREVAAALAREGVEVLVVDNQRRSIANARLEGLRTYYGNALSEEALQDLDFGGLGHLVALTANDELNSLAALHFAEVFGRDRVFQLPAQDEEGESREERPGGKLSGRVLFDERATHHELADRFALGAEIRRTPLTEEFDFEAFRELHGETSTPLFGVGPGGELTVFTAEDAPEPRPDQVLISLVDPGEIGAAGYGTK